MNGYFLSHLKNYCERRGTRLTWGALKEQASLPHDFDPLAGEHPFQHFVALLAAASKTFNSPPSDLLVDFGRYLAPGLLELACLAGVYPQAGGTFRVLEEAAHTWLPQLRSLNPSLAPPVLRTESMPPHELAMAYQSGHKLCLILRGVIEGLATHFGESITIDEPVCMLKGAPLCRFHLQLTLSDNAEDLTRFLEQMSQQIHAGEEVQVFASYKGVPVNYPGIVLMVGVASIRLRTAPNILTAAHLNPSITLGIANAPRGIWGTAAQINEEQNTLSLTDLRPASGAVGLRKDIRVEVEAEVRAEWEAPSGQRFKGKVVNLSASGLAVRIAAPTPRDQSGRGHITLHLPIKNWSPFHTAGGREANSHTVSLPVDLIGTQESEQYALLRFNFCRDNSGQQRIVEQYVMQRQIEVLHELRKIHPPR